MKQLYEFEPDKIILVGDSAGGNLVAALLNLLIDWNIRQPDGICLIYPALNLNYHNYTPSLLTCLNDMILPHTFLKICLKSYLKDPKYKPEEDYYVSPILTPQDMLKKYPPTRIFVGSKDPFHDDCCRLSERLRYFAINIVNVMLTRFSLKYLRSFHMVFFSSIWKISHITIVVRLWRRSRTIWPTFWE